MKQTRWHFVVLISLAGLITFSCSKQSSYIGGYGNPPRPDPSTGGSSTKTDYRIDITFDLNPDCQISYDTGYYPLSEKYFSLVAGSDSSITPGGPKMSAGVSQSYAYYGGILDQPIVRLWDRDNTTNYMWFEFESGTDNYFTIPQTGGTTAFTGQFKAMRGNGRYLSLTLGTYSRLSIEGFTDTLRHTGKLRLYGTLNL